MLKVLFHLYVKGDRGFVQVGTRYVQGGMFNKSIVGRDVQGVYLRYWVVFPCVYVKQSMLWHVFRYYIQGGRVYV